MTGEKKRFYKTKRRNMVGICFLILIITLLCGCAANVKTVIPDSLPESHAVSTPPSPPSGTIWPGEGAANMFFVDRKARYIDDIVTIIIEENASGENSANTKTSKDTSTKFGIDGAVQTNPDRRFLAGYELGGSTSSSLNGAGNTNRDGKLSATITARVAKVYENGNLFVEGKRKLAINNEEQYIIISGIVRPEDISEENTVSSQYIADANIVYTGKGVIDDKMKPGWLTRILDTVWPF